MNFYQILFAKQGFNSRLTWYENLFASQLMNNGYARINSIKGNTIVWNQLAHEFTSSYYGATYSGDVASFSDGIVSMTASRQYGGFGTVTNGRFSIVIGHKYLISLSFKPTTSNTLFRYNYTLSGSGINNNLYTNTANVWNTSAIIHTAAATGQANLRFQDARTSGWDEIQVKNLQVFDLTAMGLDSITSVDEFTKLFPLPYYQYNAGELLSFNGTGIKVVGFNQWDEEWEEGDIDINTGQNQASSSCWRSKNYIPVIPCKQYYVYVVDSTASTSIRVRLYGYDKQYIGATISGQYVVPNVVFTIPSDVYYIRFAPSKSIYPVGSKFCINISDSSKNGTYAPYSTNTLELPIQEHFPTGMKSAGNVFDELTSKKAIKRIAELDMGNLTWSKVGNYFKALNALTDGKKVSNAAVMNMVCVGYQTATGYVIAVGSAPDKSIGTEDTTPPSVRLYDTSIADTTTLKNSLQGVKLYYELATPTETDIDIDLTYKVESGGTEQLLPINTDVPVTSPLSANIKYPDRTEDVYFTYRVYGKE